MIARGTVGVPSMTVRELIELPAAYPPELRVVVNDYADGFDDDVESALGD